MKAMILAAGRGERLRPWTDHTPKPLLPIGTRCLIETHIERLVSAGIREIVINLCYRGQQIKKALGDGAAYGARITYSDESRYAERLDTGGGIANALDNLGNASFLVVNGDVWTDFDYAALAEKTNEKNIELVLVANPVHHPEGDFGLSPDGCIVRRPPFLTYAGIGRFVPCAFQNIGRARFPLADVIRAAIVANQAIGRYHDGLWIDVGRPTDLARARDLAATHELWSE